MYLRHIFFLTVGGIVSACSGPAVNSQLQALQEEYRQAADNSEVAKQAPVELKQAKEAVNKANVLWQKDADEDDFDHQLFVARNRIAIALETAKLETADATIKQSESNRNTILLKAREQKIQQLQQELETLHAKRSDRGMVMTLSNVLFAVNEAALAPGAQREIDQLSEFLRRNPERKVRIEGFTDNTGSDEYNLKLSQQRAETLKQALTRQGIAADRLTAIGYGEAYPVASNDNAGGRQQNRRVEIIISDSDTAVAERR